MAIVHSLKKESWVRSCKDLALLFLGKFGLFLINKVYNVVGMIFDPYTSGQIAKIRNTKDVGGGGGEVTVIQVGSKTFCTFDLESF